MSSYYDLVRTHPNLVAYWRLGESSGNTANEVRGLHPATYSSNNGAAAGAPQAYSQTGALSGSSNKAILFNNAPADGHCALVSDHADFDISGQLTLECWVKIAADAGLPSGSAIFSKLDIATGPPQQSYGLMMFNPRIFGFRIGTSGSLLGCAAGADATAGVWYYLVGVYDGSHCRLYQDGVEIASSSVGSVTIANTAHPVYIGGNYIDPGGSPKYQFPGYVDEAAIYNTALSPTEVADHYAAASVPELEDPHRVFNPLAFKPTAFRGGAG